MVEEKENYSTINSREDMTQINSDLLVDVYKLGKRHSIANYEGMNYVMVKI
jgi:hypothetical protein